MMYIILLLSSAAMSLSPPSERNAIGTVGTHGVMRSVMYINDVHHFIALVNGNQSIVCPSTAINPLFARQQQSIHCLPVDSNQSIVVCLSTAINPLFARRQQSIHIPFVCGISCNFHTAKVKVDAQKHSN